MSTTSIVADLMEGTAEYVSRLNLAAPDALREAAPPDTIPTTLSQLNRQVSRTYDLSVTAAGQLSIPVVGSVSGGFDRRVVVLERTAFKEIVPNGIKYQYGYAIRLAITVNKVTSDMKLSLPFLAASAEVGRVEGKWMLQVVGLSGPKVDAAILPPEDLNVETFILAKQSLTKLINAVNASDTTFTAVLTGVQKPGDVVDREYRVAVARGYALGRVERGRSITRAIKDLESADRITQDTIRDTYKELAGITDDDVEPSGSVRAQARTLLGDIKIEPR